MLRVEPHYKDDEDDFWNGPLKRVFANEASKLKVTLLLNIKGYFEQLFMIYNNYHW